MSGFILDIPRTKCWVKKEYLTGSKEKGFHEGYAFAVTLLESRPLLFTVHLVDGAVFSRLPIWALRHKSDLPEDLDQMTGEIMQSLDPWGAISSHGQVIEHQYLKDYLVRCNIAGQWIDGRYLFTIDYSNGGFAQDPEQHKTSNVIALSTGHFVALPNNMCLFLDRHFTGVDAKPLKYQRNQIYFTLN